MPPPPSVNDAVEVITTLEEQRGEVDKNTCLQRFRRVLDAKLVWIALYTADWSDNDVCRVRNSVVDVLGC